MKITILGGGNMGGAIASGFLLKGIVRPEDLCVSHPRAALAERLKARGLSFHSTQDNLAAARGADFVLLAVKPWLAENVLREIAPAIDPSRQAVASVVAGLTLRQISSYLGKSPALFRIIPNTAIALGKSATFISAKGASTEQEKEAISLFEPLGKTMVIPESQMAAYTALCSCGIAYALRYIGASLDGAARLGLAPGDALPMILQTVRGATALLETNGSSPQSEIDKVTTPGGLTFKGLEAMARHGFSDAVMEGLLASNLSEP